MKLIDLYNKIILQEYTDKVINQLIDKFKKEKKDLNDDEIKRVINRFEAIKPNIPTKLKAGQIILPPRFTQPDPKTNKISNPQDIFQYSWKELEYLIDSYGEKATKTSKDFYTVQDAELVKISGVPIVYDTSELKVYEGSNYESCIKLNYAFKYKDQENKVYTYNFCIGRKEDYANRYYAYRFGSGGRGALYRTFYFVVDPTQSPEIEGDPTKRENFKNWYHFFVIHAFENGKYGVTDTVNQYGTEHELDGKGSGVEWNEIGNFMTKYGGESGKKAWDKIKNHKDIFKYVSPSEQETDVALVQDKILNLDTFKKLTRNQKAIYIGRRADEPSAFTKEMFNTLDPELKNLALRSRTGYKASFNDLKNNPGLLRSYAKFRFSRGIDDYKTNKKFSTVLPLAFVPYLDNDEKKEYLKTFENELSFSLIEKYFGEDGARDFVQDKVGQFSVELPPEARKYMTKEQRDLYDTYSLAFRDAIYDESSANDDSTNASELFITLPSISQESYTNLSPEERKKLNDLYNILKNDKSNIEKYSNFFMGYPIVFELNNKPYLITRNKKDSPRNKQGYPEDVWVIMDENGNTIKDNIKAVEFFKNKEKIPENILTRQIHGKNSVQLKSDDFDTIQITDQDYNIKTFSPEELLKESIVNNYMMRQLKYRAGIIK